MTVILQKCQVTAQQVFNDCAVNGFNHGNPSACRLLIDCPEATHRPGSVVVLSVISVNPSF